MSEVDGLAELRANFAQLGADVQRGGARRMVAAGGRIVVNAAKAAARNLGLRKTGALIKNIVQKREPQAPANTAQVNVGVRHGRDLTKKQKSKSKLKVTTKGRIVKKYVDDPFYWKFLEFTTEKRAATPYLAPAMENNVQPAVDAMNTQLEKELAKVAKP